MFRQVLIAATMSVGLASGAYAATVHYQATLTGASEVPPTTSQGTGQAQATLNTVTHQLTYDVTFQGLSTQPTMAHFHGPAAAGSNAGVQIWISEKGTRPKSPLHGTATLTPEQQQQLMSGMWYVNVHTSHFPSGAIRGQMVPAGK